MADTMETTPQRVRRLAKEYVERFYERRSAHERKWLAYSYTKGYFQAVNEQADEVKKIDTAIVCWENGELTPEELVGEFIDPWIERILERAGVSA
jgi:hypothetical protein